MHISRKGNSRYVLFVRAYETADADYLRRRESDIQLEYEVVKCLKQIFNNPVGVFTLIHFHLLTSLNSLPLTKH